MSRGGTAASVRRHALYERPAAAGEAGAADGPERRSSVEDADQVDAATAGRPGDVEADGHAFAQAVDARDRADDLHQRALEDVLAAGRDARQRSAFATVVDARDDR